MGITLGRDSAMFKQVTYEKNLSFSRLKSKVKISKKNACLHGPVDFSRFSEFSI